MSGEAKERGQWELGLIMAGAGTAAEMTQFMTQFGLGNKGIKQEHFGV